MRCSVDLSRKPQLDFLFRYEARFDISCPLGGAMLPGTSWLAFMRITNQLGKPKLMGEEFDIPQISRDATGEFDAPLSGLDVSLSGGFALGPGKYVVEIALTSPRGNAFLGRWRVKCGEDKAERHTPSALESGAVEPFQGASWDGALAKRGLRLTVLLHVDMPGSWWAARFNMFNTSNREYLLQSLASLLHQLPVQSVDLIAFSLDGQTVFFQRNSLDAAGFLELKKAVEQEKFDTVSYQALRKGSWAKFLVDLMRRQADSAQPPDAMVFIGPWGSHANEKLPQNLLGKLEFHNIRIFDLDYCKQTGTLPDGIERITKELHGTDYPIDSPRDLAHSIEAMPPQIRAAARLSNSEAPSPRTHSSKPGTVISSERPSSLKP